MAEPSEALTLVRQSTTIRAKALRAHGRILNVFLQMQIAAHKGNPDIEKSIGLIAADLPPCFAGDDDDDRVYSYIVAQSFLAIIAEFENLLVEVMSAVVSFYPQKLGNESFRLSDILELGDQATIVRAASERYINAIMYKRASEYRKALVDLLSADPDFLSDEWAAYVECKARRDVGVHNGWKLNETYKRKLAEVGVTPSPDVYLAPSNDYFFNSLELLANMAKAISDHCQTKF